MGLRRVAFLCGAIAALTLSPLAVSHAQQDPPSERDRACERSKAPPGRPPFCEEYPPPERDVACDRSQAPPGRPPSCEARNFEAASTATVVLWGPLEGVRSVSDARGAQVQEYTVQVDQAGVARFEAPEGLTPGRYQIAFAPQGADADLLTRSQSFEVVAQDVTQPGAPSPTTGPVASNGLVVGAGALVATTGGAAIASLVAARRRGRERAAAG